MGQQIELLFFAFVYARMILTINEEQDKIILKTFGRCKRLLLLVVTALATDVLWFCFIGAVAAHWQSPYYNRIARTPGYQCYYITFPEPSTALNCCNDYSLMRRTLCSMYALYLVLLLDDGLVSSFDFRLVVTLKRLEDDSNINSDASNAIAQKQNYSHVVDMAGRAEI
jgi:hypothetical protein